ncbi:zinc finger protein Dzip1-like [Mizuhopecten yessoensis]|uniref:Zinc finger protein DZIP1L n=1 Tax=Mizuhopecten yessoensis TaxID=6573 RepID=A0A210QLQ3_MIZYE|nr:zinc finger protein Dzip1-like [Mizuhopecten yessoensis]XP_021355116.1 zinc finger protein Dzip1-like [Mizuhopecten yessoensis]OWF49665.1 Zinc finger protein DZIP1L [Mizuhopecten yessoensis]
MATEFMYSNMHNPSMGSPYSNSSYGGYTNGYAPKQNGKSFAFRKRFEKVDWRKIASVDINQIAQTLDFNALQENIMNITFCNIEAELDLRMVDPNFVKLFKLGQLSIEYLLHSQEYLTGVITSLEEKMKKSQEEQGEMKQSEEKLKQQLTDVKKESHKRKKLLMAQQQLIHAGSGSYNKCPFCSKAFLNSSFLQSHMNRRHGDQSIRPASIAPPTHQEPAKPSEFQRQMEELRERLQATESQLQNEKIKRKQEKERKMKLQQVEGINDSEKEMYQREIHASNKKISDLERAFSDKMSKRSGLGELEDDVEVEKELLQQQREEVAMLKEELGVRVKSVESDVENRFAKQEKKWQKKVQNLTRQHADDIGKLNVVLEKAGRAMAANKENQQQQREVQSVLKRSKEQEDLLRSQGYEDEVEKMYREEQAIAQSEVTPLRLGNSSQGRSMMMPSDDDDDETTEMATASHSLTQSLHSTYRSGELTLRTTQFLEELRKNPTLKVMRDELASLLQDHLQKIGIPPEMRGIPNDVLLSKMGLLKTRRQATVQKYPIFPEFRRQCNAYAEQQAKERLKEMKRSPVTSPAGSRTTSPQRQQGLSPPSQSGGPRRTPQSPGKGNPSRPGQPPVPKPQPRVPSPQRTMQSTGTTSGGRTGSSVDWTSTQWDSDDDDEESEDEPAFQHVRQIQSGPRQISPTPKPRMSPHRTAPVGRTAGPQVKTVISKPLHDEEDDWDDDESEMDQGGFGKPAIQRSSSVPSRGLSNVQPKGQKVAELSRSIEFQLAGRKAAKPAGGVDMMARGKNAEEESDSNWDVSSVEEDISPTRSAPKKAPTPVRGSHASDTTNTYGTSVWGSSSKGASTVPAGSAAGRGSFVSVTDVSSDDELDLDNI